MKSGSPTTASFFESLESRLFFSIIPSSALAANAHTLAVATPPSVSGAVAAGTGITAEYFSGNNFQTPLVVRNDNIINFDWTTGRPDQVVPKGTFPLDGAVRSKRP